MDIPNAKSHRDVIKKGYLQKLTSRSFPYIPHPWKRKYCLLVKGYLYFYEREDSKGADKGSGVVNLEYYDQVQETRSKDSKKASNVFSITSLDKTFFDQGRHLFSADTAHDMNDWITLLKRSIEQIRINIRPTTSTSSTKLSAPSSRPVSGDAKTNKTLRVEDRKREENIVKGKKRKDNEHDFDKENEDDSQRCTETSLRNKRGDPLLRNNSEAVKSAERKLLGRKKSFENQTEEASQIDLGHKPKGKTSKVNCKSEFKYAPGDLEGMMFDSLGRQRKADRVTGSYNKGAGCDSMGSDSVESSGSNCESKKRKADDDASESIGSRQQLESVTKNRVKGPAGRRRPQSRRTQQMMMMKNRASSLSALAHNGVSADSTEGEENSNSASFIPWLNRSLELLEDQSTSGNEMSYIYADQDNPEELFEYNIGFNEDTKLNYEDNINSFVNLGNTDSYNIYGSQPLLNPTKPNHSQQNEKKFQQYQHQFQQQRIDRMDDNNDVLMIQDVNIGDTALRLRNTTKNVQQNGSKFNVAVQCLQKHVVELDQAVNGIVKEVDECKIDLGNMKASLLIIKKEKDSLSDSVSIITQEASKMREQVASTVKECEKLQKTATSALVVAEKAKIDQLNLKKEYENMIIDLKSTIDKIKKEAVESFMTTPNERKKIRNSDSAQADEESDGDDFHDDNNGDARHSRGRKKKKEEDSTRNRSNSKLGERGDSKSNNYPSFLSNITKGFKKGPKKTAKLIIDDIPMMDETIGSPITASPVGSDHEIAGDLGSAQDLEKSNFNISNRPCVLHLKTQRSESPLKISPDSPTHLPFDVPRFHLNGRATSPTRYPVQRPGSTSGPLSRQGSMTTVPEDRAIDVRHSEIFSIEPHPHLPTSHILNKGAFAISRQNSSPNIATQKSNPVLPRQASLGVVFEESKSNKSRHGSLMSIPDDRLIVDRTLPISPSPSMMSFPGSWSTTSLNKQNSVNNDDQIAENLLKLKLKPKGPLEQVAGVILSGSSLQSGKIALYEEKNDEPPLATSSLKRRKNK